METQLTVLERLKSSYRSNTASDPSLIEGSFTTDSLSANAVEFEKAYAELDLVRDAAFPQTSWGDYLTMKCAEHGVLRREATAAKVVLTLTGTAGAEVKAGTMFATPAGLTFTTNETVTLGTGGTATVKATAQETGAGYNVDAGTITNIPVSIYGVNAVTNAAAAIDGYDVEDDATLLERLLFKVRTPATSGNASHYVLWAQSVSGVGKVKVKSLWAGEGTVKVVVADVNSDFATEELLGRVRTYIEAERPIGPTVTVEGPERVAVTLSLKQTDGTATEADIKAAINAYFRKNLFELKYISVAQIGRILLDSTAMNDYVNLTVNGGTDNITVTDTQLPAVEVVVFQ